MKKGIKYIYVILTLCIVMFFSCSESSAYEIESTFNKEHSIKKSIYSWNFEDVTNIDNFNKSIELLEALRVGELYQRISDFSEVNLKSRIKDLSSKNIKTYYLTGDPTWYSKPSSIIKRIDRVNSYNKTINDENERIAGIVLDIEPWTLGDFNIDTYSKTLSEAHAYAKSVNVKMVLAIPFWLKADELEKIVPYCDRISVMNYTRRSTVPNISDEINIAKKYSVEVESISETKAPDGGGIPDSITFFNYGLDDLNQEWIKLMEVSGDAIYSYHDLESMQIMVSKYPNSVLLAKNKLFNAMDVKTAQSIESAKEAVNKLSESNEKKYLLGVLETLEGSNSEVATSNFDIYIKSKELLSILIHTNQLNFNKFNGLEDSEILNAVNISINSTLPYQLNAYLESEIANIDGSNVMDKKVLNIRDSKMMKYKEFEDIKNKLILSDNNFSGNNNRHSIDFKLKGGLAYKESSYKTTVKFEAVQI